MTGDCESERIWKLIESSRSLQTPAKKKSSLTLLEHISNVCADVSEKLQDKRFTTPVNVLEQLLGSVVTPSVVIDLLPGHEGYTVSLSNRGGGSHAHQRDHQITLPYEDTELLDYLDAGHIPPVLLELIDRTHCCQLVDGCLVVELRNHRGYHNSSKKFSRHHFLLKPTAESVIAAVNHAVNIHKVTDDDGLQLESKILLATQPPLCLDTSTDVTCVANRLQYNKHKFHTHCIKRYLKRRAQAVQTRARMMQNAPPPKYLRLHQVISRDRQVASHDLSSHDPTTAVATSVNLALPAAPDKLLQEVNKCLPKEITAVSSVETSKQSPVVTTTANQEPLLMKNYDENADQYLVKPTKAPVIPLPIPAVPTVAGIRPRHTPPILSPIERPYVFASTVHPTSGHKATVPPPRGAVVPLRGALVRSSLPMTRPIPSITPVRPSKPRPATPTSAVKFHVKTPPQPKLSGVNTAASITGVPITVSPVVNIRPPGVMAQLAGNKPFSVAISNPTVPVSVNHQVSVANSNLSSVSMSSPGVSSVTSVVSAGRNVMINFTAPPAGVTPLAKIRPPFQDRRMQLPPILRKRPAHSVPPRPAQPIQKPATPPPPMLRASSPIPPPRPPPLRMGPRSKLTVNPQKPPELPPPPVLPRMPMLQRGALRSSIPTTSAK